MCVTSVQGKNSTRGYLRYMTVTGPDTAPPRRLILAGYAGFVVIGWNAVLIPALIRSIEHAFQRSDAAFALLYFISSLLYAGGALGGGFLVERVGRQTVFVLAALLLGLGLIAEGFSPSWLLLLAVAPPINAGAGAIDGGTNGLFLDLFREARAGALNLLHVFFGVGALVGPVTIGLLLSAGISWRVLPVATGLCCLPLAFLLGTSPMPSGRRGHSGDVTTDHAGAPTLAPFFGLAAGIGFYVAAEIGVSSWLVRLLAGTPIATATAILSGFWGGLALGRLLSNWIAERVDYFTYTLGCILLGSLMLAGALLSPWLGLTALLFGLTGLTIGPIYPMIMALGGTIYAKRLAALSGGLSAAAVAGSVIFPPLIGVMAATIGIRGGLFAAAALGVPEAAGVVFARVAAPGPPTAEHLPTMIEEADSG